MQGGQRQKKLGSMSRSRPFSRESFQGDGIPMTVSGATFLLLGAPAGNLSG
jgi:hypothetical protein